MGINRELAEDAAEEYASIENGGLLGAAEFADGWYAYCADFAKPDKSCSRHFKAGYIAARNAPDD